MIIVVVVIVIVVIIIIKIKINNNNNNNNKHSLHILEYFLIKYQGRERRREEGDRSLREIVMLMLLGTSLNFMGK